MSILVVRDPEVLEIARAMGFTGKVLLDTTEEYSITFLSDTCVLCDDPWTVKVSMLGKPDDEDQASGEELGPFYLCEAHLEHARGKWPRPIHVMLRRIDIE
ncbi:MAG: hypothetical protein HWN68_19590 [Desulfobacterales bacterium]|nr:hypothetical protein [Desulfobacterales bacterium]